MLSIKTGWEVHNDIQLISKKEIKMFTQCYSNLTEKKTKGALFYVLAIVLVCLTWKVYG